MAQVLKTTVRTRIEAAALSCFADQGYDGTTMAQIAARAQTAPANVYRYFASKEALFTAVVPADLADRHNRLLDTRIATLAQRQPTSAARELLDFWLEHRLAVVVLLDRADGTPYSDYPASFVQRLIDHAGNTLIHPLPPAHRKILELVFDNTRRALAQILLHARDRNETRELIEAFWSYQLPGLNGLLAHLRGDAPIQAPWAAIETCSQSRQVFRRDS
jgi:AcrR family transcriptional regulator